MTREVEISVASYTLSLYFDNDHALSGSMIRQPDGVEARFSSPDCLLHLLEGMVGRRAWQEHHEQILAAVQARRYPCA